MQVAHHGLGNDATKPLDWSAHPWLAIGACEPRCSSWHTGTRSGEDASRRAQSPGQCILAVASRSNAPRRRFARATAAPLVDPGSPARADVSSRRGRRRRLDLAPDILALCPTGRPRSSAEQPTRPLDVPLRRGARAPAGRAQEPPDSRASLKPIVGTTNKSVAAIPAAWLRRKVVQL
jgi:hypothetical protein